MLVTFKAMIFNGQKEWGQITRAIGQVKKRYERASMGKKQREQLVLEREEGIAWEIRNLVGMMFQTILQRKSFNMWFKLSFHRASQQRLGRGEGEGEEKELRRWWADLVKKTCGGRGPEKKARMGWGWIMIFRISKSGGI
jgi:hypothetical protein